MHQRSLRGRHGENRAEKYLLRHGYIILDRNWSARFAEIDIIAQCADTIHFFEVKTRYSDRHGHPYEAVSPAKIAKIKQAGLLYVQQKQLRYRALAVGVVGIWRDSISGTWQIQHVANVNS